MAVSHRRGGDDHMELRREQRCCAQTRGPHCAGSAEGGGIITENRCYQKECGRTLFTLRAPIHLPPPTGVRYPACNRRIQTCTYVHLVDVGSIAHAWRAVCRSEEARRSEVWHPRRRGRGIFAPVRTAALLLSVCLCLRLERVLLKPA